MKKKTANPKIISLRDSAEAARVAFARAYARLTRAVRACETYRKAGMRYERRAAKLEAQENEARAGRRADAQGNSEHQE